MEHYIEIRLVDSTDKTVLRAETIDQDAALKQIAEWLAVLEKHPGSKIEIALKADEEA